VQVGLKVEVVCQDGLSGRPHEVPIASVHMKASSLSQGVMYVGSSSTGLNLREIFIARGSREARRIAS